MSLFADTRICVIHKVDGTKRMIRSGLKANLLEVNADRLNSNPNLARIASNSHGYLAILLPRGGGAEGPEE